MQLDLVLAHVSHYYILFQNSKLTKNTKTKKMIITKL